MILVAVRGAGGTGGSGTGGTGGTGAPAPNATPVHASAPP